MSITLYAATSNPGKLGEFAASASTADIRVLPLPGLAAMPEPVEDALTFMGNAEKKAIAYSLLAPGLLVFADDSGLEVDALGGEPGVRSARYADDAGFGLADGEPADVKPAGGDRDRRNIRYLLLRLAQQPDGARTARFVSAIVLARDGKVLRRTEGFIAGEVLSAPRGAAGFGYDPLFLVPSRGLTLAELSREEKWELSHRGHAFRALVEDLRSDPLS
jgi:XTP/dITP diphosphohydrolase